MYFFREQSRSGYREGLSQASRQDIKQLCKTTLLYSFGIVDLHNLVVQIPFSQTSWTNFIAWYSRYFKESFLFLFWGIRTVSLWSFLKKKNEKEYNFFFVSVQNSLTWCTCLCITWTYGREIQSSGIGAPTM
jgi:hypothetical protein